MFARIDVAEACLQHGRSAEFWPGTEVRSSSRGQYNLKKQQFEKGLFAAWPRQGPVRGVWPEDPEDLRKIVFVSLRKVDAALDVMNGSALP